MDGQDIDIHGCALFRYHACAFARVDLYGRDYLEIPHGYVLRARTGGIYHVGFSGESVKKA